MWTRVALNFFQTHLALDGQNFPHKVHPDKLPPEDKQRADQAFKRVNDAAVVVEKQIRRFTG